MNAETVLQRIESLRAAWETRARESRDKRFPGLAGQPLNIVVMIGKRYARIVREENGRSAAGFVDLTDGNIYYPAGWAGPTKNIIRGNVNAEDFGLSAFGEYAVKTVR